MDKKVTVADIEKIINSNSYEKRTITYDCGGKKVKLDVNPCVDYDRWFTSICTSMSIILGEQENYNPEYMYSISSIAYKHALITCFINIGDKVSSESVMRFAQFTDVACKIEEQLPQNVLVSFKNDFDCVMNVVIKKYVEGDKAEQMYERLILLADDINKMGEILNAIPTEALIPEDIEEEATE